VQIAWKALHFAKRFHKKGNRYTNIEPTYHWYVLLLNMGLHDEIHAEKDS